MKRTLNGVLRISIVMLVLIGMMLSTASLGTAQEESQVTWLSYDVTVEINDDGTARVTEDIVIEFNGSFRQGHRSIPMDRIEEISDVTVSVGPDTSSMEPSQLEEFPYVAEPGSFEAYQRDNEFVIDYAFERTSPDNDDVQRAVSISYTVDGVIRVYPDVSLPEQQLRWTAISSDVTESGPVESASATVIFPEDLPAENLAIDPDATTVEQDRVVWEREELGTGDSLHVAVAFPPVTDAMAPAWQAGADRLEGRQEHIAAISMLVAMVALVTWVVANLFMVVRGVRDPEVGLVADIIPQRPDDLPAALVGTLVDESVDTKDVLAGLLDLDRRGIVRIYEDESKKKDARYRIELLRPIEDADDWDRPMLTGLFSKSGEVGKDINLKDRLKKLREKSMSEMSKAYETELYTRGYFQELPRTTRMRWVRNLLLLAVPFGLAVGVLSLWTETFTGWMAVPLVIAGVGLIVGLILTTKAAVKTTEGAIVAAKWKAYGRYVEQMKSGPSPARFFEMLEQDLPWAVALGFDSSWTELADAMTSQESSYDRQHRRAGSAVFVGGFGNSQASTASQGSGGGFGGVQGASAKTLAAIGGGSAGMFAMLNDAAASFNAGSGSGSSSGGGFSGSASIGSSGGGGHSFS